MNRQDAAQLIELRQHLWTNTPDAGDPLAEIDTWALMLGDLSSEQVADAMVAHARTGAEFAMPVGAIREMLDPTPTYATAWVEFEQRMREGHSPLYTHPSKVPWSGPMIAAFAADGWWQRFGEAPDAQENQSAHAAFRKVFRDGFASSASRSTSAMLASAEQARIDGATMHELREGTG